MNDMQKDRGNGVSGQGGTSVPNADVIKGLLAIILGIIAIALAYKVIVGILLFFVGLILLYYGAEALKLAWITRSVDDIIRKIRAIFRF